MNLWKKKLAARLHDPAEKALVLMRDVDNHGQRIGHEEGSVAELCKRLGIAKSEFDVRADHYAAAADRPQWPCQDGQPRPAWANVRFVDKPVLIHPLSGEEIALGKLTEVEAAHIRHASLDHFSDLIEQDETGQPDYKRTLLAFWRFGPEPKLAAPELGELWRLLPADTRVPDHSIWAHLDVTSALAGALAEDTPALLTMSFGPVQGFIAQARSTSDLWAGSHLLSSLAWEGLKVICEELGPDAVLFPLLRGIASVDRWLLESAPAHRRPAWETRFKAIDAPWLKSATDANPLFAATLPNKFMALVPASRAQALAEKIATAVRAKAQEWAVQAAEKVFSQGGGDVSGTAYWRTQIADQLNGFPEVHHSVSEWPTATDTEGFPASEPLEQALAAFYPDDGHSPGFFDDALWKLVAGGDVVAVQGKKRVWKKLVVEGGQAFFVPNPGLLYPAVYDLAERGLAAAKSLRGFDALPQRGTRCTLTGEHEWLTDDATAFTRGHGEQKADQVWSKVAGCFGIKAGEQLGAPGTLKRLWPRLFVDQVREFLDGDASRYVVSTHTMALVRDFETLNAKLADPAAAARVSAFIDEADRAPALPRLLARLRGSLAARVPAALDRLRDAGDDERRRLLEDELARVLGHKSETYYALILMDGDRMGAWMAGNEAEYRRRFADTWHPDVRNTVRQKFGNDQDLMRYLDSLRPASPARHAAISGVLNDFSTHVARHVVEDVFKGKLLYAGGDDVLAMMSVDDLLPAMLLLRAAYSGVGDGVLHGVDLKELQLGKGFLRLQNRLMLMMGSAATASIGAVVAHHQAPLGAVLRLLHEAEGRAKGHGRNAFCLRVMKRGGGEVAVTSSFWENASAPPPLADTALGLMLRFADTLAQPEMSRRAVYHTTAWLAGLPPRPKEGEDNAGWREMIATNLAFQLQKQDGRNLKTEEKRAYWEPLAWQFVSLVCQESTPEHTAQTLADLLVTTEFFARESRSFGLKGACA